MSAIDGGRSVKCLTMLKKYDICLVRLDLPRKGSHVQGGFRPAVIVSNDVCNRYSPVVTIVPLTSKRKKYIPTHLNICGFGLNGPGIILCEQITVINRTQVARKIGHIYDRGVQNAINHAICTHIAM